MMRRSAQNVKIEFSLSTQAAYYLQKYGEETLFRLQEAADFWESEGKLKQRNAFLRLADEIQMEYPHLASKAGD